MNSIEITKKLISIPSCVDSEIINESRLGQWIYKYFKENTDLKVKKQYISKDRFNVIAYNNEDPEILIAGHLDTVQPKKGWITDPFVPVQKDEKVYGLGASDMKSGLAVILTSIIKVRRDKKIMALFYCDEEYDFLGMKKFIQKYKDKIKPKLIISADGETLKIGNACRGLIELTVRITGKSGHAAIPSSGINAITQSFSVINSLKNWLRLFSSFKLGKSTLNIAFIKGGTNMEGNKREISLGREGNIIPDYCEYVVEIRTATPKLNARLVKDFLIKESTKRGLKIIGINVRHDLGSWITSVDQLKNFLAISPYKRIISAKRRGYIDIQMLWEAFGKVPCFSFGAGEKGVAHKENEFVKIKNIKRAEKFYENLIVKNFLK